MHWLKLEYKLLFGGLSTKLVMAMTIICAIIAIDLGEQNYQQLRHEQTHANALFEQQMQQYKQQEIPPGAGTIGYYVFAPTQWQLSPWTVLFAGQSQSAYAAMPIRALALQSQIYNREVVNPSKQKAGQLDLGFVLIYLLPLVLGILSVSLLSDERQSGRWRMLSAMKLGGVRLLWLRLAIIATTVMALGWSFLLLSALWLTLPLDGQLVWLMLALGLYLVFWTLVIGFIISFAKSSVFNTLSFMSIWLTICVLIPASIQLYLDQRYQAHPALKATLEQRLVMNNGWDQDQQATMNTFKQHYPEYRQFELPPGKGSWHWYYAQQQLSDQAVSTHWQAYLSQQQQRADRLNQLSLLSPSLLLQLAVNRIANSGGEQHLAYIKQVAQHHSQIRQFLYRYLYSGNTVTPVALDNYPRFNPASTQAELRFMPFVLIFVLLMFLSYSLYLRGRKMPLI